MDSRRFVIAAALGTAVGAAVFFVALEATIDAEAWGRVAVAGVLFGLFMAAWNGTLIHLDSKQRTTRNVIFENAVGEWASLLGVAWLLAPSLEHLRWQDLVLYTVASIPILGIVWLITRKNIKGERRHELFA